MNQETVAAMLAALNPEIVANFKQAIALGKWADGRRLSEEQKETCMQAVLLWEMQHLPEQERTGYIHKAKKDGEACESPHDHHQEQQVKFVH
ncbi:MAG: DUF1315 family protein [Moraxellaceae bacterium]|nr:DUF1315 family protein [Pseudomonadales bacterium]MCB1674380.1 DUF1315 family protein [Pseudomonadales bacterium]MCP5176553.1 DUF1315 family protein [Moraxellaceae bacterium]